MKDITTHHDGHGFNESIRVSARDIHNNVPYEYVMLIPLGATGAGIPMYTERGNIRYQRGPVGAAGSQDGVTELAVLAVVEDRLSCHQEGPFACEENKVALQHIRAAMKLMRNRADRRADQGTLNTLTPEKKEQ